ncbi:GNAT family N-acetyltransferase [Gracilibacillus oryzae]|uniref:GNAT family N-acetyltransferase n=1 Tax=Gracilibacillus oryzae TaxID=1672701 RepID=A0A7C8KWD9_9BACI|nr:GNAT family N-acetyltransferase [Gracilibacillus oryzae]KAB8138085.1 GNAT family N-acetyltransferase [Gracilibacillus oryzae]
MHLTIEKMDENAAGEITGWRYEEPYDFYNHKDEETGELLEGSYRAIMDEHGDLVGFLCTGTSAQIPAGHKIGAYNENCVDIGLGMAPAFTGKGNGYAFCTFIIEYIQQQYPDVSLRLSVATFNRRAIHLYHKLGFVKKGRISTETADFMTMVRRGR